MERLARRQAGQGCLGGVQPKLDLVDRGVLRVDDAAGGEIKLAELHDDLAPGIQELHVDPHPPPVGEPGGHLVAGLVDDTNAQPVAELGELKVRGLLQHVDVAGDLGGDGRGRLLVDVRRHHPRAFVPEDGGDRLADA